MEGCGKEFNKRKENILTFFKVCGQEYIDGVAICQSCSSNTGKVKK